MYQVSFIEMCPLFGVSFIRGSTVPCVGKFLLASKADRTETMVEQLECPTPL